MRFLAGEASRWILLLLDVSRPAVSSLYAKLNKPAAAIGSVFNGQIQEWY